MATRKRTTRRVPRARPRAGRIRINRRSERAYRAATANHVKSLRAAIHAAVAEGEKTREAIATKIVRRPKTRSIGTKAGRRTAGRKTTARPAAAKRTPAPRRR